MEDIYIQNSQADWYTESVPFMEYFEKFSKIVGSVEKDSEKDIFKQLVPSANLSDTELDDLFIETDSLIAELKAPLPKDSISDLMSKQTAAENQSRQNFPSAVEPNQPSISADMGTPSFNIHSPSTSSRWEVNIPANASSSKGNTHMNITEYTEYDDSRDINDILSEQILNCSFISSLSPETVDKDQINNLTSEDISGDSDNKDSRMNVSSYIEATNLGKPLDVSKSTAETALDDNHIRDSQSITTDTTSFLEVAEDSAAEKPSPPVTKSQKRRYRKKSQKVNIHGFDPINESANKNSSEITPTVKRRERIKDKRKLVKQELENTANETKKSPKLIDYGNVKPSTSGAVQPTSLHFSEQRKDSLITKHIKRSEIDMDCATRSGIIDLEPYKYYLLSFSIHDPFKHVEGEKSRPGRLMQRIVMLNTHSLEKLKDKIICPSDYQEVGGDVSDNPFDGEATYTKDCATRSGIIDLEPYKYYLLSFSIHDPFKHVEGEKSRPGRLMQRIVMLNTHSLEKLKDKIICPSDYQEVGGDVSDNPFDGEATYTKDVYTSSMFYFDNSFYVDCRNESQENYATTIKNWAYPRGIELGYCLPMHLAIVHQLHLRMGYPYVYVHQGCCEHLVIINDARLIGPKDSMCSSDYPLTTKLTHFNMVYCATCTTKPACWVVRECDRLPQDPCMQCDGCFAAYHYKDKKKIGHFKAYRWNQKGLFRLKLQAF